MAGRTTAVAGTDRGWRRSTQGFAFAWPFLLIAAGCGGGGGEPDAASPALYRVADVGPAEVASSARDVNRSGVVVGTAAEGEPAAQAFVWKGGHATDLGGRAARAVNDQDEVVGESGGIAYLWRPGHASALTWGAARDISNRGEVVGEAVVESGDLRAFLWDGRQLRDLGTLGGAWSSAYAVNDAGQVVGWAEGSDGRLTAFLWSAGGMESLGTLGGTTSMAYGINDLGHAVGYASTEAGTDRAFLFDPQEGMRDLGTLGGYSVAYALDNLGRVVGESLTTSGRVHACLWEGGRLIDLNDRLPAGSGWELVRAFSINDAGQIAGEGMLFGRKRAFLLSPAASNP